MEMTPWTDVSTLCLTPLLIARVVALSMVASVTFTNCNIYQNTASGVSALAPFGSSNAPMESLN